MTYKIQHMDNGEAVLENVPIFPECRRGDDEYDTSWLRQAFQRLKEAQAEGHEAPIHVYHHGGEGRPEFAGRIKPRRIGKLKWRGKQRDCIYADLVFTNEETVERLKKRQLPYRSVEISDDNEDGKFEIVSLSLLDSEPPYVEMPMTFVDDDKGVATATNDGVTYMKSSDERDPALCFRRDGGTTTVYMESFMSEKFNAAAGEVLSGDDDEALKRKKREEEEQMGSDEEEREEFSKDEDEGEDKPDFGGEEDSGAGYEVEEEMPLPGIDVPAVCEAIGSGMIPVADFAALRDAMSAAEALVATPEEEQAPQAPQVPGQPTNNPPDVNQMKKDTEKDAKLFKLESRVAELENERERDAYINEASAELRVFSVGSNPREKLSEQYKAGASEGGHKGGMARLRHFVSFAKEGGYPRAPGTLDTASVAVSDLPEDATKLLNGDATHDEAVARAFDKFSASHRFSKTTFAGYWSANSKHFLSTPITKEA